MIVCYWAVVLGFSVGASIAAAVSWRLLGYLEYTLISISGLVGAAFVLIVFGRTSEKA